MFLYKINPRRCLRKRGVLRKDVENGAMMEW